jgi:glycosyltransferase involved in cell wall biosynthesis
MRDDVTVVIPTLPGREELLQRALASVYAQTRPAAAIAIVRDNDRRGAWWARNRGARMTLTGWIAWLDDDDELLPHHLEVLLAAAADSGAGMVYGYPEFVGPDGGPWPDALATVDDQGHLVPSPLHVPFGPKQAEWLRRVSNFIPVTHVVRAALVERVGGMPQPFSADWPQPHEDWGFLIRLLDAGVSFHNAQQVTWRCHIHGANTQGGQRASTTP